MHKITAINGDSVSNVGGLTLDELLSSSNFSVGVLQSLLAHLRIITNANELNLDLNTATFEDIYNALPEKTLFIAELGFNTSRTLDCKQGTIVVLKMVTYAYGYMAGMDSNGQHGNTWNACNNGSTATASWFKFSQKGESTKELFQDIPSSVKKISFGSYGGYPTISITINDNVFILRLTTTGSTFLMNGNEVWTK